jgi:vacuolar-type H+-ATPase subunit C/Vma6
MADIINLRTARKQKARAAKEAQASQNRILFGRTKAEKLKQSAEKERAEKIIDAHKRDD